MIKYKQLLHIEPPDGETGAPDGWLNDPNGLSFFDGKYHVFFQYSPNSAAGKTPRCWGHYSGESLTKLNYVGVALSPEIPAEKDGVYSGSAIEKDGVLHLFYTGNVKYKGDYNYITNGREGNVIHVSSKDGAHFEEKQVLLTNADYPDFCSCHVRDPKVWREGDEWRMVLGARTTHDKGCVLVYKSADLLKWEYITSVSVPDFGYMWECPDYFVLDGKDFLSVSPQGLPHFEDKYQNLYQSGYFSTKGKLEDNTLGEFHEWDMGFDFYAPQTFEAPNGRRILVGWMGMDTKEYSNATTERGWQHCLTLPREVTADSGKLKQKPIREIDELFGEPTRLENNTDICVKLPFDLRANVSGDLLITLDGKLNIKYSQADKTFSVEFIDKDYGCGRTIRRARCDDCTEIRIIADMSSLEIYVNDGELVFSTRFYPDSDNVSLKLTETQKAQIRGLKE